MQSIVRLEGALQEYAWGSRTALAELLGRSSPSAEPQAELWLGAHPRGEARVVTSDGERVPLRSWIERDPEAVLGAAVAERFERRLPFLLKILAVERALSLQAHPDADQAYAGFTRERRMGASAEDCVYADPHAKPELVVAHTPFRALVGLRPLDRIRDAFERVGLAEIAPPPGARAEEWLPALFATWLAPVADVKRDAQLARACAKAGSDRDAACLLELAAQHPNDPGVIAPLLLHAVDLQPGDALFLEPGVLHCYLGGVAAEIMAASDNVLRAGLTTKPRAVGELLRIGRFTPSEPHILRAAERAPGLSVWPTPAASFELSSIELERSAVAIEARSGVEILLCHAGEAQVTARGTGDPFALRRGESCLVPAAAGAYRLDGTGALYRAGVPAARVDSEPIR